jgi:hypothetical protein
MKTKFYTAITICCLLIPASLNAQWINSITIQPLSPTTNDTITVLADCSFPSGGCSDHTKYSSIVGTDILAGALHCLGPLSVICNFTDTFKIDPLPAGNYTFHLQIDAGFGPSPCSPGIVPGPTDFISFVVSPFTGVNEIINQDEILVFPNPAQDQFKINGIPENEYPIVAEIFSVKGESIKVIKIDQPAQFVNIHDLNYAMYQMQIKTANDRIVVVQFLRSK